MRDRTVEKRPEKSGTLSDSLTRCAGCVVLAVVLYFLCKSNDVAPWVGSGAPGVGALYFFAKAVST